MTRDTRNTKVAACGMPNASKPGGVVLRETPSALSALASLATDSASHSGNSQDTSSSPPGSEHKLSLHVHREAMDGRKIVDRLELVAISDVSKFSSVFRRLLERAFSGRLPDYMTSSDYYLFKPRDEFLHAGSRMQMGEGAFSHTEQYSSVQFRLVVEVGEWETVVCMRGLHDFSENENDDREKRKMLIAMAQFDSDPVVMEDGVTKMQVCLEGYSVSVEKKFLDSVSKELLQDHESFYMQQYDCDFPALSMVA